MSKKKPATTWIELRERERQAIRLLAQGCTLKEVTEITGFCERWLVQHFSHNGQRRYLLDEYKVKLAKESTQKDLDLMQYASARAKEHYEQIESLVHMAIEQGDLNIALRAAETLLDRTMPRQTASKVESKVEVGLPKEEIEEKEGAILRMVQAAEIALKSQSLETPEGGEAEGVVV